MKNILVLNGSLRKKTTYALLKRISCMFADDRVEFLNLGEYDIHPCIGCENCLTKGDCKIQDQANDILNKVSQADGIIIGTPVYLRQISGYLKVLIDRGCSWYHRSPLVGKPILFVTATQASGTRQTIHYLKDLSLQWGTINTGHISRTMFNADQAIPEKTLQRFKIYLEETNKSKYRPTIRQIIEFNTQKVLAACVLPLDFDYWTEHGYLNTPYYYPCKINPLKRMLGCSYYRVLSYFINKNKAASV